MTIIAVIVYNRYKNLEHWLHCWSKCEQLDSHVVIIHNYDEPSDRYKELCESHGATYLWRENRGFDIGAFQDVCRDRLPGFPAWERLLWMTDDTFPMAPDFLQQFNEQLMPGVGVVCMEISPYVITHIRTTGFMLKRSVAERLTFPADPVITKEHCYQFEHRAKEKIFYAQVKAMGLVVKMVAPRKTSPLWDVGYHRRMDRRAEHAALFGDYTEPGTVVFICPIFKSYPQIISSLLMQTHANWRLILIHDGPDTENVAQWVPADPRIVFFESPKHGGCWGHYIRQVGIKQFSSQGDFVVVTNPDNYHVPVYCEYMLRGFRQRETAVAVYCSEMVHSYRAWRVIPCRLEQGYLDCAGVMVRSWAALQVGWREITEHSADWTYFSDLIARYGPHRFHKVDGVLLIHN